MRCSIAMVWSPMPAGGAASKPRDPAVAGAAAQRSVVPDFKGEFKLGNGRYCYPLTVSDQASRYLLAWQQARFRYPFHDRDILVTARGRICMHKKKMDVSTVLAGQKLVIKEVDDDIWLVRLHAL